MKYYNINNLTINQINIFLCAAESNSFSDAAQKLNYTQPLVSKTINSMEEALGLILFVRDKYKTVLTPAGRSLYQDLKEVIYNIETAINKAHIRQSGISSIISLGCTSSNSISSELEKGLLEFHKKCPDVVIQYNEYYLSELINSAKKHELDVIITAMHDASVLEQEGYDWKVWLNSCLAIGIPRSNPLASRDQISIADLRGEDFISLSPVNDPNYVELLMNLCAQEGFSPKISAYVSNERSLFMNMLQNNGVALCSSRSDFDYREIKLFPLREHPEGIILAWDDSNKSQPIHLLIETLLSFVPHFTTDNPYKE